MSSRRACSKREDAEVWLNSEAAGLRCGRAGNMIFVRGFCEGGFSMDRDQSGTGAAIIIALLILIAGKIDAFPHIDSSVFFIIAAIAVCGAILFVTGWMVWRIARGAGEVFKGVPEKTRFLADLLMVISVSSFWFFTHQP
jgi:hypothetical protein